MTDRPPSTPEDPISLKRDRSTGETAGTNGSSPAGDGHANGRVATNRPHRPAGGGNGLRTAGNGHRRANGPIPVPAANRRGSGRLATSNGANGANGHVRASRALGGHSAAYRGRAPRWEDRSRRARAVRRTHLQRAFARSGAGAALFFKLGIVLSLVLLAFFVLGLGTVAYGAYYAFQRFSEGMPDPNKLIDRAGTFKTSYLYDRNGKLLYELYNPDIGRRTIIPYEEFSPYLIWATVATEDANFFYHEGVDPRAIIRALYQNYTDQRVTSGASTITQQLVRNVFFDVNERFEQSYERKIREAILAYRVTQTYSKEQILQMYLNEVSYGNLAYGAEAAAQFYFGKSAKDLNLAEAATLAGIPQSPNLYNPLTNPVASKVRRNEVLDLMEKAGYFEGGSVEQAQIPLEEVEEARQVDLKITPPDDYIQAPHWVWFARDTLERRFGRDWVYQCGCDMYTTLDLDFQNRATEEMNAHLNKIRVSANANNAAVVVIDPHTGEILAMVGSPDYYDPNVDGQVNMALVPRQPGSTLKPFTYVTAMERFGINAATVIDDTPISVPMGQGLAPWRPTNFDFKFHGRLTVRQALARSMNIPVVKVLQQLGVPALLDTLHRVGITTLMEKDRYGLAVTLGGGEVKLLDETFAYSVLANNGVQIGEPVPPAERQEGMREYEPVAIRKIVRREDGKVEYEYHPGQGKQVLSPQASYQITAILTDDRSRSATYGLNSYLVVGRPAAAKTGTTDDYRDGWTMGYTPDLVVGVWVGNSTNRPMRNIMGISAAGYIWHNVMLAAFQHFNMPVREFERPEGMVMVPVDFNTGRRPGSGSAAIDEWFIKGKEPVMWANPRVFPDDFKKEIAEYQASLAPTPVPTLAPPPVVASAPPPQPTVAATATPLPPIAPPAAASGAAPAATPTLGAVTRTAVNITSPANGDAIRGQVYIYGTASVPNMRYYKVEFTSASTPGWHTISGSRQGPIYDAPLELWNTAGLPPGAYQVMVTAVDAAGNWQQSAPVTVNVSR